MTDKALFTKGVKLHERAIDGDKQAAKKAYELFAQIFSVNPHDRLVQAYLGSATSIIGRDLVDPLERHNYATKGLKLLDDAVAKEGKNLEIRSLRGYVCFNLPEAYFKRTSTAIEDFKFLITHYEKTKTGLSDEYYHQILFDLGTAYKRLNKTAEAKAVWDKLLKSTTDPKYRRLIKQERR